MGNPFPPGLKPVWSTIDQTSNGPVINNLAEEWARNPPRKQNYEGLVTTDEYLYVDFPPGGRAPRFKLRLLPKPDSQTDEQYAWYRRGIDEHTRALSVFMHVLQALCTWVGNHRTCREAV